MRSLTVKHKFVTAIPDRLDDGTLYIALDYRTVMHKCLCGCGEEVSTPLGPTDWKLTYDGVSVSLYPSIGNWALKCRSHYWIERSTALWAAQWSDEEIAAGRAYDRNLKERHYPAVPTPAATPAPPVQPERPETEGRIAGWLRRWWS